MYCRGALYPVHSGGLRPLPALRDRGLNLARLLLWVGIQRECTSVSNKTKGKLPSIKSKVNVDQKTNKTSLIEIDFI